jgi:anhydro-N-acetylmuramic acid kinase
MYIGLMSGTSMDGVDAVLVDFGGTRPRLLAHVHHEFAPELRRELLLLNTPGAHSVRMGRPCATAPMRGTRFNSTRRQRWRNSPASM